MDTKSNAATQNLEEIKNIDKRISWSKGLGIALGITSFALAFWPFIVCGGTCAYNEFGDYVGGVSGSLLSLGAMAFLYMTFQMQRRQVVMQQSEMIAQAQDKISTERIDEIQKFEEWFFNLLKLHNETVRSFDLRSSKTGEVKNAGRDCFKAIHRTFIKEIEIENKRLFMADPNAVISDQVRVSFSEIVRLFRIKIYKRYEGDLDTYFKSLGGILRHINKHEAELKIDIYPYIETVRSQLSTFELILIYYFIQLENSTYLAPISKANIKLFKQFDLLQHLQHGKLLKYKQG